MLLETWAGVALLGPDPTIGDRVASARDGSAACQHFLAATLDRTHVMNTGFALLVPLAVGIFIVGLTIWLIRNDRR